MSKAAPVVIPDELVMAAIERAIRHYPRETSAVPAYIRPSRVPEALGSRASRSRASQRDAGGRAG